MMEDDFRSGEKRDRGSDRRRRRLSIVLHERRSGFDRRLSVEVGAVSAGYEGFLRGIRDRPGTIWVMLVGINALNLADYLLTLNVLANGGGEANPLMASLFDAGPVYAGLFKFIAILAVTFVLWHYRRFRPALQATLLVLTAFTVLFIYHMVGLTVIV
jgi:hypothetical protein